MQLKISSPRHYEAMYGSSDFVRAYLDQIEKRIGESITSETVDKIHISLLIAHPNELSEGKFLAFEKFDWRCRFIAVGVNGDFEQYHMGDDMDKIRELSQMLQNAFAQISKKKKAKFDCGLIKEIIVDTTHMFESLFSKW